MEDLISKNDNLNLPARTTVRACLDDLIAGRRSREAVADWAGQFIRGDYDDLEVTDFSAWEMLSTLAGADLKESPTEYLHDLADIKSWARELDGTP